MITTPVILNLIALGLESVKKEDFGIEAIASKDSLREAELEKKILDSLEGKIEALITRKLSKLTGNVTDKTKITGNLPVELTDNKELEKDEVSYELTTEVTVNKGKG